MDQREQRDAMLRARRQAVLEYQKLKAKEREQSPHIPKAEREGMSWFSKLLIVFLMLIAAAAGAVYWAYTQIQQLDSYQVAAKTEPYVLKEGATLNSVVRDMAGKDFHPYILNAWVKIHSFEYPVIQRGDYAVDGVKTLPEILADMREGNVVKIQLPTVSVIEGMNISMIKRRLLARDNMVNDGSLDLVFSKPEQFIRTILVKSAADETLLQAIGGTHKSLEGLLMPATYEYEPGKTNSVEIVAKSLVKMAEFMREHYLERNQEIDSIAPTPYHVLILASLVERESSIESEQPLIAGVFVNRLKKGIRLQTDPAVMYGVSPDFKGPLRLSQLRRDTPYNTYTRAGLPPTPIAMPSEASILAVLNPAATNALYFVARGPDPKQGHIFSASLQEHNRAVAEYRKAVKDYKEQAAQAEADAAAAAELSGGDAAEQAPAAAQEIVAPQNLGNRASAAQQQGNSSIMNQEQVRSPANAQVSISAAPQQQRTAAAAQMQVNSAVGPQEQQRTAAAAQMQANSAVGPQEQAMDSADLQDPRLSEEELDRRTSSTIQEIRNGALFRQ